LVSVQGGLEPVHVGHGERCLVQGPVSRGPVGLGVLHCPFLVDVEVTPSRYRPERLRPSTQRGEVWEPSLAFLLFSGSSTQGKAAQGDGEVSGTALEQSLTGVFRFVLHKGIAPNAPRAETATHYLGVGIDIDLDRALRNAVQEVIDFLVEEKALAPRDAFILASLAVDFMIAEAVNETQVVVASIPKTLFVE